MIPLTTKESILAAKDEDIEEVPVEPWGGTVFIRAMSSRERDAFEMELDQGRTANFRARLASICLCNEDGKGIFTEADAEELGKKSGKAMGIIVTAAMRLNSLTKAAQEEIAKKSQDAQESGSNTNSA